MKQPMEIRMYVWRKDSKAAPTPIIPAKVFVALNGTLPSTVGGNYDLLLAH